MFASTNYNLTNGVSSFHRIMISFMSTASQIYPMTAIVLYNVICYASMELFNSIHNEMKRIDEPTNALHVIHFSRLKMLTDRHLLSCDTVDAIYACFGWTLLLSTCFVLIAMVGHSFRVLAVLQKITLIAVSFSLYNIILLILICFPTHRIKSKV